MATRPTLVKHVLTGTNKVVPLEDVYANIGTTCGIEVLGDAPPANAEVFSANQLVKVGILRRAKVRLSTGKIRTVYLVAANTPQVQLLVAQEYITGVTIKSAYFPQRITLG